MATDVDPAAREDESIVVDLNADDEAPPAQAAAEKAPSAKPPPVPGPPPAPQQGLEELNRQMHAERAERERVTAVAQQIARERDQAVAFAQEAERRGVSTYELYTENQIKACQDKMESLAGQSEQAMHDGDFKRASSLNLEIGRLGGNLAVMERDHAILVEQRQNMVAQARQPQPQPRQQQPQQPALPADPFERALVGKSEATQQFLRKHPDLVRSDGTIKRAALDAHERAKDEGYQPDTPGYFEYIERSLMANTPTQGGNSPTHPRGAPTVAAPVTRGGQNGGAVARTPNEFVMTPKMRRLAEEQGVEPREWARNYVKLLQEGRITPIT